MYDNQWSSGVVIARSRSLGALNHQRRDLHTIKLSYLTEDRASSSITNPQQWGERWAPNPCDPSPPEGQESSVAPAKCGAPRDWSHRNRQA
jgi:hypothetical protein